MLKLNYSYKYYLAYVSIVIASVGSFYLSSELKSILLLINSFVLALVGLYALSKNFMKITKITFNQGVWRINRLIFKEFTFSSADIELISSNDLIIKGKRYPINAVTNKAELIVYIIRELDVSKSFIDNHEIKNDFSNELDKRILSGSVFYRDLSVIEQSIRRKNKNTVQIIVWVTVVFLIIVLDLILNIHSLFL